MASSKVANRYAQSFLDTSVEKNILASVSTDFDLVYQSLIKSKELLRTFKSPVIKKETKQSILKEIFSRLISKDSMDFLNFVIEKGREELFVEILERFEILKDEHVGAVKVNVITAFDFSDTQKIKLQQKFEAHLKKDARLNFITDPGIIGGFVAKVGDTVYNASMLHQLELLRKQLLQHGITLN